MVLADDTVSRFHAVIAWDPDEDRPYVLDNESANGVEVDGELIDVKSHLPGGNQVTIGKFTLVIEVISPEEKRSRDSDGEVMIPELNDSDSVVLYTEKKEQITGRASTPGELQGVLLDMESQQRTGTLTVRGAVQTRLTFCQGLLMTAQHGELTGRPALRELMLVESAIYGFSRELRPVDDPLNVSVKTYLETELSELTKKIRVPPLDDSLLGSDPPTRLQGKGRLDP